MTQIIDVIYYTEDFMTKKEADELFKHLMEFKKLTTMMEITTLEGDSFSFDFGKMMFLDQDLMVESEFPESIWGSNTLWTEKMLSLRKKIEKITNDEFKTCVCIFYPDGGSGVDYHSDKPAFGDTFVIPVISLGEERLFNFRDKRTFEENAIVLKHGSLLTMGEGCQENFEHSLPFDNTYKNPRISLTFRKFGFEEDVQS